jgi:hypothetical protein
LAPSAETRQARRDIRVIEYNRLNAQIAAIQKQIDAETARLNRGKEALAKIDTLLGRRADRIYATLVANREGKALAESKGVEAPKQTNLQRLENRIQTALAQRNMPGAKVTGISPAEKARRELIAERRARAIDKEPAKTIEEAKKRALEEAEASTRIKEVGSATNEAIDRAQEERATSRQYAEELSDRKQTLETKKNRLLGIVETL